MLKMPKVQDYLGTYIDAGFPILYIQTYEESKADRYIEAVSGKKKILEWNGANGFVDFKTKLPHRGCGRKSLEDTLSFWNNDPVMIERSIIVIKDAEKLLEAGSIHYSEKAVALLKEFVRKIRMEDGGIDSTVIIVSPTVCIPASLEKFVTVMQLELPGEDEIRSIIERFQEDYGESLNIYPGLLSKFPAAMKGLSEFEIVDLLKLAVAKDGELTDKTLNLIFEQKKQMILKAGILELVQVKEKIEDIGGLENLKEWLKKKAGVFGNMKEAEQFGVPMPKGVLIAGIPGCGKSLTAKAAGSLLHVPLLKLDMGRLMGKYVGESEENMRKAIELAEAISPCVLWVDEMEKAFAGISGGGSEVTTRLFGTFLTWMQDKTCPAFVIATANDISHLPPELMRKGRFDEIFYVGLPNPEERRKIIEIHINKRRKQDFGRIDIDKIVSLTEGYSGADLESVIGESVERAFVKSGAGLTTDDLLECIGNTHSLSEIMKDSIQGMADLYEERKFKKASR